MKTATKVVWLMALWVIVLTLGLVHQARAESFFQAEVGLGAGIGRDMGDDVWVQKKGVPDSERLVSPAVLVGVAANIYRHSPWDLHLHLDYTFIGQQHASCMCVSDADYYAGRYNGPRASFSGFGHVQGVSLTFEPGYTWGKYRYSVEAGPWVNWATWHESVAGVGNFSHRTTAEFGYVFGAGVERGKWGLHYRYYSVRQAWNPNPGILTGIHMVYVSYHF